MKLLPFLLLPLLACHPRLAEGTYLIAPEGVQALAAGERLRTDRRDPDLFSFVRVVEDSRCPRGVQCVQAGRAVVAVRVLRDGAFAEEQVVVGGGPVATDRGPLQLLSLEPYPDASVDDPEPYRLSVRFGE